MSVCRSCSADVEWVSYAAAGKVRRMPLDVDPDPAGNIVVHGVGHLTVYKDAAAALEAGARPGQLRRSHFATCPNAGEWRK